MRLLLNLIWFVFAGFWTAIGYAFAALIMFLLIITIPFGIAACVSESSRCGRSARPSSAERTPAPP